MHNYIATEQGVVKKKKKERKWPNRSFEALAFYIGNEKEDWEN